MNRVLKDALDAVAVPTPLKFDCGKLCGAVCCGSLEGEESGMLLFPGEEEICRELPGWKLKKTAAGILAVCPGTCDRSIRPLACRIFPLLPVLRDGQITVETDERARHICPLARSGKSGMDSDFISAVEKAGRLLAGDPEQRDFLTLLTREQDDLKALRKMLKGR